MRYFVPTLHLVSDEDRQSTHFSDHFGGIPWGLPEDRWPHCPECKEPMIPLVQVAHHPQWMNLGRNGRKLYAFQCWKAGFDYAACASTLSTGQVALLLEPEDSTNRLTRMPLSLPHWHADLAITSWEEKSDLIDDALVKTWMEDREGFYKLPAEIHESVPLFQKSGSLPSWWNGPRFETVDSTWRLLLQFGDQITLKGPLHAPESLGARGWRQPQAYDQQGFPIGEIATKWAHTFENSDDYAFFLGNFGMGTAWILGKNMNGPSPKIQFIWDR